ncbi:hypothetical protein PISL3812_07042 [Talaromyces islandicus]|uniref:Aflatoxin regulatory protein domain-containing protein n=1 Tax=Talaromyces islandicus TaxID=28573 RepID=A0A0U1M4Q4_TALIS|nr:hypothetical protein PISL3812_07042 [Talaromyces islandicus]
MMQRQPEKTTSDLENHIPGETNTGTRTDNWLSWDLPSLTSLESTDTEMQNFHSDAQAAAAGVDILPPGDLADFQIFDPMLFDTNDNSLFLQDEDGYNNYAAQTAQKEQADSTKENDKKQEKDEINMHTIASTLEKYLQQLNAGPPEITLSKILFTTSLGNEKEEEEKKSCQRAHTVDSILQHTTHFINLLKADKSPASPAKPKAEISTETLLRTLAIYTTILKLFLILFAHIHDFLHDAIHTPTATTTTSTTGMSPGSKNKNNKKIAVIEPVPDVQFIGFDIQSGHLQVTLFMQIVIHLIRSMESLLGISLTQHVLDDKPTITATMVDDDDDVNDGVAAIIDAIMHREAQTIHHVDAIRGYGGVPALRKEMDAVKQLLEQIPL